MMHGVFQKDTRTHTLFGGFSHMKEDNGVMTLNSVRNCPMQNILRFKAWFNHNHRPVSLFRRLRLQHCVAIEIHFNAIVIGIYGITGLTALLRLSLDSVTGRATAPAETGQPHTHSNHISIWLMSLSGCEITFGYKEKEDYISLRSWFCWLYIALWPLLLEKWCVQITFFFVCFGWCPMWGFFNVPTMKQMAHTGTNMKYWSFWCLNRCN